MFWRVHTTVVQHPEPVQDAVDVDHMINGFVRSKDDCHQTPSSTLDDAGSVWDLGPILMSPPPTKPKLKPKVGLRVYKKAVAASTDCPSPCATSRGPAAGVT